MDKLERIIEAWDFLQSTDPKISTDRLISMVQEQADCEVDEIILALDQELQKREQA